MGDLIQLVQGYRDAASLDQRLSMADTLLDRIAPDLQLFVLSSCHAESVEDLVQEVLVQIVRGLLRFEGQTDAAFWAWCYRIARNKLADHFRGKAHRLEPMEPDALFRLIDNAAPVAALSVEDRDDLTYALRLLSEAKPECLEPLWNHFVIGLDYGEIAEARGLTYDSTRMKIGRCLEAAQALMAKPR